MSLSELNDLNAPKALIKQLLEENEQLQAENAELRRRLGLDSTNSHKPPSRDGYTKKYGIRDYRGGDVLQHEKQLFVWLREPLPKNISTSSMEQAFEDIWPN